MRLAKVLYSCLFYGYPLVSSDVPVVFLVLPMVFQSYVFLRFPLISNIVLDSPDIFRDTPRYS